MSNLKTVLENLRSDKIKERQEGLSAVRTVFAQDKVVANFHINLNGKGDPRAWLPVFQALFQTVRTELEAMHRMSSKSASSAANAERRLADAASVVRWLTERTAHLLNKGVVRALFEHFLQTMVRRRKLVAPVALDYAKALRCLVTYTPHLEHMEDETWVEMVELAFNAIMNDPITTRFAEDPVDGSSAAGAMEADDLDLYAEDDPMGDVDEVLPSTRKRGRRDSTATQMPSSSKMKSQSGRNPKAPRQVPVSLEQVEFMSLLSVLYRSPSSPLLSPSFPYLPSSILLRLQRFLDIYPPDTSLQHDYLLALSSTLSTLSLNKKHIVEKFARASWDGLVRLWGTKNKRMKEGIIVVLRILFPFVISDNDLGDTIGTFDCAESIGRLWYLLDGEAESRWGVDCLSLDCLRLELVKTESRSDEVGPFVANTFRSGWNFDEGQALAWAILELQADCTSKLFLLSESMHPPTPSNTRAEGKRVKLESPVTSLLASISGQPTTAVRVYHLQILLFFIDRHWLILHDALQNDVIHTLLQLVSYDEGVIQSWVFLCFAAIAYANSSRSGYSLELQSAFTPTSEHLVPDFATWDSIWTNAIRRVNVPIVCRAACHAAHSLLHSHSKATSAIRIPLSPQRVLLEIETLGKDLDVQGPAYPYDSVCAFLAQCMHAASQDMRLYRMHLEEKVLSWLVDSWKVVNMVRRMSLYLVKDILLLLEGICGLTKKTDLVSRVPLPQCQISDISTEQAKTKVIRDFLMDAQLPIFRKPTQAVKVSTPIGTGSYDRSASAKLLIQPRGRARKVSTFLLKSLEALLCDWEDNTAHATAEKARLSLDVAITALSFESALILNGTQANRRVVQCACKLVNIVTALLADPRWTAGEKALILLGLDPLISTGNEINGGDGWDAMLPPDVGSGIKAHTLKCLTSNRENKDAILTAMRMDFLRIIWQNADVQDAFNTVTSMLRGVLRAMLGAESSVFAAGQTSAVDNDGFGPIRTTTTRQSSDVSEDRDASYFNCIVLETCIAFLTVGPALQSASGEATRDKSLTEVVLSCAESRPSVFILVCPILLQKTRQGFVNLSVKNLDNFLDELGNLLQLYEYARSRRAQLLAAQFLDSTLDTWASGQIVMGEVLGKVRNFCDWLFGALKKQKIKDWFVRDFLARFLDRYLAKDPDQSVWSGTDDEDTEHLPDSLLPMMTSDEDIRVRFRVAVINARLFAVARRVGRSALTLYDSIKQWYTVDLDNYERMLTRMLSLGNIMVVSSTVRRGPYWHLLETCIHSPIYSRHIECILRGVSERMGLERFSLLFESYASQLAYSIRQADSDFLRFPPHILGYHDRKECAQSTFSSFTPTNIWNGGRKLFEGHCKVLQMSIEDGLRECFGDILGYQIVTWIDEHDGHTEAMEQFLKEGTFGGNEFEVYLKQNMDDIVAFILRTLGDQDFSDAGPIVDALRSVDNNCRRPQTFQALARYRRTEDFDSHKPNLPTFPAETVLQALSWLHSRLSNIDAKATTYHVLHQLFAQIEHSPLINEQVRLINAISLWIACHHEEFSDATLLHTLIHGATSLLKQSDLARSAQSILEWAFDIYRGARTKDPSFPNVLIRIACLAHDYATDSLDDVTASLGNDLLGWIDAQALNLSKVPELSSQILRVLPAWPHDPSPYLSKLSESVTVENLSAVLEDHRVSSNKFRLVRRLHDHARSRDYDEGRFAKSDFWRLKECMPSISQLQEADIDAFIALIFLNRGRTNSFDSELPNSGSLLSRHRRGLQKQPITPTGNTDKAQEAITLTLLTMLRGDSAQQAHVAYNTLRLIKSVAVEESAQYTLWPSEHQAELRYLEAYRRSPKERPSRDMRELLIPESFYHSTKDFSRWIADVTMLLSDILSEQVTFFAQLTSILQSNPDFAEQILPVLVHTVLQAEQAYMKVQGESYRLLLSTYFTSVLSSDFASILCLRSIVNVVLHLRHFPLSKHDALSYNKWLDIDFTLLARSGIKYGAYTTALLFLELARDDPKNAGVDTARAEEQTLYEIYRHIDEPDGFYGISDDDLHQFLIKRFHHEKQWDKAFQFHGAALEAGSTQASDAEGLVKSFHSFGFDSLAIKALQTSIVTETAHTPSTSYRLGWRTETWDLPDQDEESPGSSLYVALRAIHRERDAFSVDHTIESTIANEMERLRSLGSENFAEIREVVQELLCLREIKQWRHELNERRLVSKDINVKQWRELTEINVDFDFSHLENIMATRISLLRSVRRNEERQQIGTLSTPFTQGLMDIEKGCLLRLSEAARDVNQIQIALNSVIRAQRLEKSSSFAVTQEFSNVLWRQKEEQVAVQLLERLVQHFPNSRSSTNATIEPAQKAVLLARLGTWSSEACLKNPTDIQDQYFKNATALLNDMDPLDPGGSQGAQAIVYHECAIFADRQYHTILNSPDATRWKVYAERKQQEMDSRSQEILKAPTQARRAALDADQRKARKLFDEDTELFRTHNIARNTFLKQAIDMYSRCLHASDSFDSDAAIRLCSLWFANFEEDGATFQNDVQVALERIPSRKFIFLAHQLSARISKPQTGHTFKNQENLQSLVVRMCREHPFHSLYQVYCLKAGRQSTSSNRRQSGRHSPPTAQVEREDAALDIFDRLRTESVSQARVLEVEKLCDACIQWAQYPIAQNEVYKNKHHKSFPVPGGLLLLKISNLRVPVITHHLSLDPTMRYDDCPWVERYESTFETAGGINLPKISVCYDSHGQKSKQLFKGNDDLRQDAVMEQVFELVNNILRRDRETKRRDLTIRDYKVIPLDSQAGVLEFVGNTIPLANWLKTAHARYHPDDMSFKEAFDRMTKIREDAGKGHFKEPNKSIEDYFKEVIQRRFRPIMRHYFTEKHKTPISWFAKRLNYTRSVATTSIVGHVLGLGDRHISNILLDNSSGQVVHIDLGIAFDQGKYLRVPELVPFRMTRDMVDGMGSSGTKGVFQRCAEETLRVLREDSEVIMTVLAVFKHDPLHSWTASEVKVQRVQRGAPTDPTAAGTGRFGFGLGIDMSSGSAEEAADRALSSVARKLDKALSVEYTVNQLVTAATSTTNLALIFPGWSPHC